MVMMMVMLLIGTDLAVFAVSAYISVFVSVGVSVV